MNFTEIAKMRQSCRNFDSTKIVESEKLEAILSSACIAPSACNGQPYHITVCTGGMNRFASDAPVQLVISEQPYVKTAALGAKLKHNDYRSIDIGIVSAYITAEATAQGLGSCILGWLDNEKIKNVCGVEGDVRLVICIGYAKSDDKLRNKKRKDKDELITYKTE